MGLRRAFLHATLTILATGALAATPCPTLSLNPAPRHPTSLVWDWPFEKLLLVDVRAGELQTYSKEGVRLARWANPGSGPLNFSRPMLITRTPRALVLTDYDGKFIELDSRLTPTASHSLSDIEVHPKYGQLGQHILFWAPTSDGLVGLGATRLKGQRWAGAWLRVTWPPHGTFEVLKEMPDTDPFWRFEALASQFVVTAGQHVYSLSFEPYGLLEFSGAAIHLRRGLPEVFGKLPALPPDRGEDNAEERVAVLSSSTGAAHLVADGSHLYVVLREMRSGTRRWLLARYDPDAERVTGVWRLPSAANDIHLAPGPKQWALLETEGTQADGTRTCCTLILLPAQALTSAGGTVDAPVPVCAR